MIDITIECLQIVEIKDKQMGSIGEELKKKSLIQRWYEEKDKKPEKPNDGIVISNDTIVVYTTSQKDTITPFYSMHSNFCLQNSKSAF